MDKKEIFDHIIDVTAEVCMVEAEEIINGSRRDDVVTARSIVVFWLNAAGFSVESIKSCAGVDSSGQVNAIKSRMEDYWKNKFAYHMWVKEVGVRLLKIARSMGENFDMEMPLNHMRRVTGKY